MKHQDHAAKVAGGVAGVLGSAATAYSIALMRSENNAKAIGEGVSELVKKSVETAISFYTESRTRRWEGFFHRLLSASDGTADEAIQKLLADPSQSSNARETLVWSLRTLDEMVDDSAGMPLVELARSYLGENRKPDWFFRGFRRILSEASDEEVLALRELFKIIISNTTSNDEDILRIRVSRPSSIYITGVTKKPIETSSTYETLCRSLQSLRNNGLASEGRSRDAQGRQMGTGTNVAEVSRILSLRINVYLA